MNSNSAIPVPTLIVCALWAIVAICLAVCWHGWWTDDLGEAQFGGFTAAALIGPASVAHIRLYAARLCVVISSTRRGDDERLLRTL